MEDGCLCVASLPTAAALAFEMPPFVEATTEASDLLGEGVAGVDRG